MEYLAGNIEIENNPFELSIWDKLTQILDEKSGILGYKIPSLGAKDNSDVPSFIIRSSELGIIIIDVISDKIIEFDEENEYWKCSNGEYLYSRDIAIKLFADDLEGKLKKNSSLHNIRSNDWNEPLKIRKLLIFADNTQSEVDQLNDIDNDLISSFLTSDNYDRELVGFINQESAKLSDDFIDVIDSILDGSDVFSKVKKKKVLDSPQNINDYIKKSLDYTFKLDKIQRQIALQVPPGPQRIRGLAGTGKTVILCMKAALAHKASAKLKILFVFNTQSMYNQVKTTITEYYFNEAKAMPNWENLHIYHAWGGSSKPGVYYNTANSVGIKPKNLMNVRGVDNPLEAIYDDLLSQAKENIEEFYDIVLIDEAQDFSPAFFETIYHLTKSIDGDPLKKRIIWAYDEFQSLTEFKITQPEELFGLKVDSTPNMPNSVLDGQYKGMIKKDFVLPNSYRNPRINLMVAHGVALGLYSKFGKVPMSDRLDWQARGYVVQSPDKPTFSEGDKLNVERPETFSKNILEHLLKEYGGEEKRLISYKKCNDIATELNEVLSKIEYLINKQKVEPEEILVINLDTRNSKQQFEYLRQKLDVLKIKSIMPGFIEPTDAFKEPGYVTLSTTFRAKGNETNIVLILNSQRVIADATFRMRNAMFVAITRSRGWCYLYGHGPGMEELDREIKEILNDYPYFKFTFPNEDQITRKLTIIQSNKDVEKADRDIDNILSDSAYRALLLEKLSQDSGLLDEINRIKRSTDDI